MKLSTKGRYGLRALVDLALHQSEGTVSIASISQRQGISEDYLEQLMPLLKKADIVVSARGAGGGYRLNKPAEEISVGEILRALEGSLAPVSCGALEGGECDAKDACVTKYVWMKLDEAITDTVDNIFLKELVSQAEKNKDKEGRKKACIK